jgi:hypothetical protein
MSVWCTAGAGAPAWGCSCSIARIADIRPLLNKVDEFVLPTMRYFRGEGEGESASPAQWTTDGLSGVDLSKGKWGVEVSSLIGSMILSNVAIQAMRRRKNAPPWFTFVDEYREVLHGWTSRPSFPSAGNLRSRGTPEPLPHELPVAYGALWERTERHCLPRERGGRAEDLGKLLGRRAHENSFRPGSPLRVRGNTARCNIMEPKHRPRASD